MIAAHPHDVVGTTIGEQLVPLIGSDGNYSA